MAVGDYTIAPFTLPVAPRPVAMQSRNNDNLIRIKFNAHQDDTVAHPTSGPIASRPATALQGAIYVATDTLITYIYTGGAWTQIATAAGTGNVVGPASATDNALTRFDGTTGKLVQDSAATLSDAGTLNIPSGQTYQINGTTVLSSTALGSGVTGSSLTSVGVLTGLTVSGASPSFNTVNSTGTLTLGSAAAIAQEQRFRATNDTASVDFLLNGASTSWGLYDRTAAKWAIQVTRGATDAVSIPGSLSVTNALSTSSTLQASSYAAIGGSVSANAQLYVRGTMVGTGVNQYGALVQTTLPVAATSSMQGVYVQTTGAAGTYTTSDVVGVNVQPHTLGSVQTVNNAYGVIIATSSFATTNSKYGISIGSVTGGASNNFALYTNTGQVRLGDDLRIVGGSLSLTTIPSKTAVAIQVNTDHAQLTSATSYGMLMQPTAQGTVTNYRAIESRVVISGTTALTAAFGAYIRTPTITAGGTIATNYGLHIEGQTGATTNYAIYTNAGLVRFGDAVVVVGNVNLTTGSAFQINGTNVLTATTLGSGVTASSLTSVGTLTSLTVSGNSYLATTSGSVGVGTTSPLNKLSVATATGQVGLGAGTVASPIRGNLWYDTDGTGWKFQIGKWQSSAFTAQMTFQDNGNVGIGTASPATALHTYASGTVISQVETGTQYAITRLKNPAHSSDVGVDNTSLYMDSGGAYPIVFYTGATSTERMRLDASGNLGLGVTPSAWNSGYKAIQNLTSSLFGTTSRDMNLGANVFVNSGGNYAYIQSSFATNYTQYNGAHSWYTAPSGTAGNTITFTQAMTLDASGNLGIGTTSPATKLDVNGSIAVGGYTRMSGSATYTMLYRPDGGIAAYLGGSDQANYYDNQAHYFRDRSSNTAMFINSNTGNVGIGTTSPVDKLHVVGNLSLGSSSNSTITYRTASNWRYNLGAVNDDFFIYDAQSVNYFAAYYNGGGTGKYASILGALNVKNDGNVGIGTTSPSAKLQVVGEINSSGGSSIITVSDRSTSGTGALYRQSGVNRLWDNTAGDVITWNSSGNVGIGTTSPGAKLDVRGDVYTTATWWGYPTELVGRLARGGSGLADLQIAVASGQFRIINAAYSSALMVVNESTGNVGIGTTSPGATLDVSGTMRVSGTTTLNGLTYTWPATQTANYVLQTNGSGALSWVQQSSPDGYTTIVKSVSQDVTNAGLTVDNDFTFAVLANNRYIISMDLIISANSSTGDYAMDFSLSGGTMKGRGTVQSVGSGATTSTNTIMTAAGVANTTAVVSGMAADLDTLVAVSVKYAFLCTADATLRFRFGNNSVGAGRTSRTYKGSIMRYKNIT